MDIQKKLKSNPVRRELYAHDIFSVEEFSMESAAYLLGQYWHPLHYFPNFLARFIDAAPSLAIQAATAAILNEELGEGNIDNAHEKLYIDTICPLGFSEAALNAQEPNEATKALVDVYRNTSADVYGALGSMYATESTDLAIVAGIGKLIRKATGHKGPIGWIDIHVAQEPGHVAKTDDTVLELNPEEEAKVIGYAEDMWRAWVVFFDAVREHALQPAS